MVGVAAGALKLCGIKLYLYLASNKDGKIWNLNPVAYANWLGLDYAKSGRAVRKAIEDGIADLKTNGYLLKVAEEQYDFSEQFVPSWKLQSEVSTLGTNCSSLASSKEQIVPKELSSSLGTNGSSLESRKEQIVPNLFGF